MAANDSSATVPSGVQVDGTTVTTTVGSNVFRQALALADPTNDYRANVSPAGGLQVDAGLSDLATGSRLDVVIGLLQQLTATLGSLDTGNVQFAPGTHPGLVNLLGGLLGVGMFPPSSNPTALLHAAIYNSTPPAPTSGQPVALQTDASGNLKVTSTVAALYTTIAIPAAGNSGTITQAMSAGNIFVPWTGLRTGPGTLTIPAAANSGNEMLVWDQANNAGAFPIAVAPASGSIIGTAVISRNRGLLRLLDSQGGFGWLVVN